MQAVSSPSLSERSAKEEATGQASDDAKALPEGAQTSGDYHDVSPSSPSGSQSTAKGSSGTSSTTKADSSDRQDSSQGQSSSTKDSKKKDSKSSSKRDAKVAAGSIGGRGTQEEYQQAKVRFMSPSGTGVCVSADSITLNEDQMGLLVTASFDEL